MSPQMHHSTQRECALTPKLKVKDSITRCYLCATTPPPHPYLLKVKMALIKDEVTLPFIGTTISVTRLASLTRSQRRDSAGIYFLRMPPSLKRSGRCGGGGAESSAPVSVFSAKWGGGERGGCFARQHSQSGRTITSPAVLKAPRWPMPALAFFFNSQCWVLSPLQLRPEHTPR